MKPHKLYLSTLHHAAAELSEVQISGKAIWAGQRLNVEVLGKGFKILKLFGVGPKKVVIKQENVTHLQSDYHGL